MFPAGMLGSQPVLRAPPIDEEQRQKMRASIRKQLAAIEVTKRRRDELQAAVAAVDDELEAITAQHVADCSPKQARLRAIQEQQIREIAERRPKSAELEAERLRLQADVNRSNDSLAEAVRRAEDKKRPLLDEVGSLAGLEQEAVLVNRLVEYGSQDLLDDLFSKQIESYWLNQRMQTSHGIVEALKHKREHAKRSGQPQHVIDGHAEAVRKFSWESRRATRAYCQIREECEELRRLLIDE